MKINVIATGSSGNLYELIDNSGNSMIIEAGMPRHELMKHRVGISPPEMCIISHGHTDHSQYKGEYQALMTTYFMPERCNSDSFAVIGFETKHGDTKTIVFIINLLKEGKMLFFGTDFEYGEYPQLFASLGYHKVENYLIECNYTDYLYHLADDQMRIGCDRHLSDNDVVRFIRKINPRNPKVITIHGSNRLSVDSSVKKNISSKLLTATVHVATGAKNGVKNVFII